MVKYCTGIALALLVLVGAQSYAQVPRTLSYQGILADSLGTPKPDGLYAFTFRLYLAPSGGSAIWIETKALTVKHGLFQTVLGDNATISSSVAFDKPYWLGIQVGTDPELSPRAALTPVGYSLRSAMADTAKYAMSASPLLAVDSARVSGALALPYSGVVSSNSEAFVVQQTGIGTGISVLLPNSSNSGRGLNIAHSGVGAGVYSTSVGGTGLWGITSSISAAGVIGDNLTGEAVVGRSSGVNGVGAVVGRSDGAGYGVRGFNTKAGIGVLGQAGISGGTGVAGRFENVNAASGADALEVANSGTGRGALITSGSGSPTGSLAAVQVENFRTSGEGLWVRKSVAANPNPVAKVLQDPAATTNFLEGATYDGSNPETRKFHITNAGTFVAGSDFAETFVVLGDPAGFEPGDVVVLASSSPAAVEKTSTPYDTRVAGVYSTRPGVLGADKDGVTRIDAHDIPVAIIGIVPTKVTNENGQIHPGDLLTCSSTPGYAMKASPVIVNGVAIYPTGSIIGKALESLPSNQGVVKVLVNLK